MGRSRGTHPEGHRHDGIEVFFVHSGCAEFSVAGRNYGVSPGHALLFDGTHAHNARALSGTYVRTALHFAGDLTDPDHRAFIDDIISEGAATVALHPDSASRLIWISRELSRMMTAQPVPTDVVRSMVALVVAELREAPRQSHLVPAWLWEIVEFMRSELSTPMSMDELYEHFHYSPSHIRAVFNEFFGCSPQQYWTRLRIKKACDLLQSPLTIDEVASLVGFGSTRSFQRAFGQLMGMSPSDYRIGTLVKPHNSHTPNNSKPCSCQ